MTGRELDVLVAERVMGLAVCRNDNCTGCDGYTESTVPHYSTDIASAWMALEKAMSMGPLLTVDIRRAVGGLGPLLTVDIRRAVGGLGGAPTAHLDWYVSLEDETSGSVAGAMAVSAPRAICLAALEAVGAEVTP